MPYRTGGYQGDYTGGYQGDPQLGGLLTLGARLEAGALGAYWDAAAAAHSSGQVLLPPP